MQPYFFSGEWDLIDLFFIVHIPECSHLLSEFLFVTFKFHIYDVTTCFSTLSLGIVLEKENNMKILPTPPCFALLICSTLTTMKKS